ncbi:MAG: hypothetical protein HYY26_05500 [Acidobacteria bacterium]|nr:hypothetical protein [Acidobacteriota bacterium]
MSRAKQNRLSRRQFAGTLAVAVAAPSVLEALAAPAAEKKQKEAEKPPAQVEDEELRQALQALREFELPEGYEPAFAFRANW